MDCTSREEAYNIWAEIVEELDGKMTWKESIVTDQLHTYTTQELESTERLTEEEVCNKFDEEGEGGLREIPEKVPTHPSCHVMRCMYMTCISSESYIVYDTCL